MGVHQERAAWRLAAVAGHLAGPGFDERALGLSAQGTAATQYSSFARQASSGANFARPCQQQFSRDERVYETAALYGDGVLKDIPTPTKTSVKAYPTGAVRSGTQRCEGKAGGPNSFESVKGWAPQANIVTSKQGYTYIFTLPGVKGGDIKLQLNGSKLTISGQRMCGFRYTQAHLQGREVPVSRESDPWSALAGVRQQAKAVRKPAVVDERHFEATWVLPEGDYSAMRAQFAHERLRITLPKGPRPSKFVQSNLRPRHNAGM